MPNNQPDPQSTYEKKQADQEAIMLNAAELAFNNLYPDAIDGVQRLTGHIGLEGTFSAFAITIKKKKVTIGKSIKLPEPQLFD